MPPKQDPYATKSARAVDLLLILLTILAILFALSTAPHHRAGGPEPERSIPTLATN